MLYLLILALSRISGFDIEIANAYHAEYYRLGGVVSTQCVTWFERLAIEWHVELLPAALASGLLGVGGRSRLSIHPAAALAGSFVAFWAIQLLAVGGGDCDWHFQIRSAWIFSIAAMACAALATTKPGAKIWGNAKIAATAAVVYVATGALFWTSGFDWHEFSFLSYSAHLFSAKNYKMAEAIVIAASMTLGLAVGCFRGRLAGEPPAIRMVSTACLFGALSCVFFLAVPVSGISHDSMDIVLTHAWIWPLFLLLA